MDGLDGPGWSEWSEWTSIPPMRFNQEASEDDLNYRNTPPSNGKAPAELMLARQKKTKLIMPIKEKINKEVKPVDRDPRNKRKTALTRTSIQKA